MSAYYFVAIFILGLAVIFYIAANRSSLDEVSPGLSKLSCLLFAIATAVFFYHLGSQNGSGS